MIWVVGCNGMLGTELCRQLTEKNIEFTGTDRNTDVTDYSILEKFASDKKIDFIVNCSAYTAVDKAESDVELATKINVDGVRNIARLSKKIGATLIHISTDYVFDGNGISENGTIRPYKEDDQIAPIGVYGKTKADGEKALQEETDKFYILRTAWLYGWAGKNFVYTMIRAMNMRESVKVVNDQKGSPTFCGDLANVILSVIEQSRNHNKIPCGIYHVTDNGETTWFEFTKEIQKQVIELNKSSKFLIPNSSFLIPHCQVNPCTTQDYPTPAKRPAYSVLSKDKIQKALGIELPEWEKSLSTFLKSNKFDKNRLS